MKRYVLGLAFNYTRRRVLLQRRTYPAWQHGLYNGIGGHIEECDRTPLDAMVREAQEETTIYKVQPDTVWRHYATVHGGNFHMACFVTYVGGLELVRAQPNEEHVRVVDVSRIYDLPTIGNIPALIALAIDQYLADPVDIHEHDRTNWRDEDVAHIQRLMGA